ncbi:hypothetical protein EDB80DRAFT_589182 [Ilyonectria destructans]|nr:hypothetical protein EDB80DRAFT_593352 [Ilyonectria destructans]KAH6984094.1 hypothetical protein EDB80DRAFT_591761 [Ilyonectria destructans]KAH6988764.1 hypothetical protein EDB80DRAFT_589182 [Ilyonectria destructans]
MNRYHSVYENHALAEKLRQMASPLAPLVEVEHGTVHPAFPTTLLQFWLLTNDQLESLAQFYHQRTPNVFTNLYPYPIRNWDPDMSMGEKLRKMGEFIGIGFCDSHRAKIAGLQY